MQSVQAGLFTPLVLHAASERDEALHTAQTTAAMLAEAGATTFITAVVRDLDWSVPRPLDASEHRHLTEMLRRVEDICLAAGLAQVLHPHVQTVVETADDVDRLLESSDVKWCLDTGHLAIGGKDPVEFARQHADRVGHVHLKDVALQHAGALMRRETSIMQSVQAGLFTPLGQGDVDIAGVITALEGAGYDGWYVIEQDTAVVGALPEPGQGPMTRVSASLDYLRDVVVPQLASSSRSAQR
jgi:inosose dehydratase